MALSESAFLRHVPRVSKVDENVPAIYLAVIAFIGMSNVTMIQNRIKSVVQNQFPCVLHSLILLRH